MEKQFAPYELAVKLKELGFDEECLGYWHPNKYLVLGRDNVWDVKQAPKSPLWQQAFEWFRVNHGLHHFIKPIITHECYIYTSNGLGYDLETDYKTYEEARLACLEKLIELCKNKQEK